MSTDFLDDVTKELEGCLAYVKTLNEFDEGLNELVSLLIILRLKILKAFFRSPENQILHHLGLVESIIEKVEVLRAS